VAAFRTIPISCDIGIVRIDTQQLKALLLPSPQQCLQQLHELLPAIAAEQNAALLAELADADQIISHAPFNVEEFVELRNFLVLQVSGTLVLGCASTPPSFAPALCGRKREVSSKKRGTVQCGSYII
jgi:hypothetical protein